MSNQDPKVADYSFLELTNVKDILDLEEEDVKRNTNRTERQNRGIHTVNLSSNKIVQITELPATLATLQLLPKNLKWIDLSNNTILPWEMHCTTLEISPSFTCTQTTFRQLKLSSH